MSGKSSGHCPRATSVQTRANGGAKLRTKLEKILDLGTAPAPLFPVAEPYPAPYPAVYFGNVMVILRDAEVAHPATEILGQLIQPVLHGDPPASSGVLLDAASEFPVCLVRPDDAGSAEDETEEVDAAGVCCFCSSAHSFALRLPPDPSRRRPCLRLVLGLPCLTTVTGFSYRGLAPHKFTPMTGVHKTVGRRPGDKAARTGQLRSRCRLQIKMTRNILHYLICNYRLCTYNMRIRSTSCNYTFLTQVHQKNLLI